LRSDPATRAILNECLDGRDRDLMTDRHIVGKSYNKMADERGTTPYLVKVELERIAWEIRRRERP
jgi:hypothetical protein